MKVDRRSIAATIRRLLRARGAGKSICPSEVARALAPNAFHALMPEVRSVAARMARANEIVVTQRGRRVVDVEHARGPIRLARAEVVQGRRVEEKDPERA
jgi:hypothetical protein